MAVELDYTGKRVLVAGASSDIGYAIAQAFHDNRAQVVLHATAAAPSAAYEQLVERPATREEYGAIVQLAAGRLGGLDILVNVPDRRSDVPFAEATIDDWNGGLAAARSTMFFTQQAMPLLIPARGNIVNVTSVLGMMAGPKGSSIEAASAGSIIQITQMSSLRWGQDGVRTNCICVGSMEKDRRRSRSIGYDDTIPLQRLTTAGDVANLALFLASSLAGNICGAVMISDGGLYSGH